MLESVVKQYGIQLFVVVYQHVYAVATVFVDSNGHRTEFLFHLVGLVANLLHSGVWLCNDESLALTFVTAT